MKDLEDKALQVYASHSLAQFPPPPPKIKGLHSGSKFCMNQLKLKIQNYISLFLSCREVTYDKDITPYIHVFVYHCHFFTEKYGPLKPFETEALEQLNYVNKLVFFGASNKGKENYTVTEQVNFLHS